MSALQRVMTAVFTHLFISSPPTFSLFFFFSDLALCFPTCCLQNLVSLSPTRFSPKRSAELYSNRQKGWTIPRTLHVCNNLPFFSFCHAPLSLFSCCYLEIITFQQFSSRLLHFHITLAILFSSPSPPPLPLHLPLSFFPFSRFRDVALSKYNQLPLKSSDPLVFSLHSIHKSVLVPPTIPCILIYIKAGLLEGTKRQKRELQQRGARQRWIRRTKVMWWLWKPPGIPTLKFFTPPHAQTLTSLGSIYLWQVGVREPVSCRNSPH